MSKLKGTYHYFKDLVDENSFDYGKIVIVKANSDIDAWKELSVRHKKQYGEPKQSMETMYEFLEKREID
jgi:hypothetical protein